MAIKKIEVTNFKSFDELSVELGNFNVIIGSNASGKSNFVYIFKFLRDIAVYGLNNAISMQGGVEYLRNIKLGSFKELRVKLVLDNKYGFLIKPDKNSGLIGREVFETTYEFILTFYKRGIGFKVTKDIITQKCRFLRLKRLKKRVEKEEIIGEGEIYISQSNDKIKIDLNISEKLPITEDDIIPPLFKEKLPSNALLLETPIFTPLNKGFFGEISIYDFDPKLCKKATPITGKAELEEDGSNLPIVLKNIIEQNGEKRKLLNLITHLLPFVNKINVEKFADKSLLFKLQEKYYKKEYIPASLISDGTINITALIIALYFEKKPFVIIEEPERNIHPYLISKIVEFMKDASQNKQIIVTTHNPEFVKWAGLDNLLLVSRENEGFSKIYRPMEKKEILNFLENDIGIDELYIQNLLS